MIPIFKCATDVSIVISFKGLIVCQDKGQWEDGYSGQCSRFGINPGHGSRQSLGEYHLVRLGLCPFDLSFFHKVKRASS